MADSRSSRKKLFFLLFVIFIFIPVTVVIERSFTVENAINTKDSSSSSTWTKCKHVTVEELDEWIQSQKWDQIPKIIHQSWKTKELRERQAQWSKTWCDQYTDWRYHLWTDDENDLLVKTKFPWFYPTYKQLTPAILQADSVRYLYMLYYGGIYVDLDYESIRRVDELFLNKKVVLSLINYSFNSLNSIPNSWMASQPNQPFWTYLLYRIVTLWSRVSDKERNDYWSGKAEFFTGPVSLYRSLMFYLHMTEHTDKPLDQIFGKPETHTSNAIFDIANITFLGPKLINAYDWQTGIGGNVCSAERPTFDENRCKELLKPIYAITYWSHSYGQGHEKDANYLNGNKKVS